MFSFCFLLSSVLYWVTTERAKHIASCIIFADFSPWPITSLTTFCNKIVMIIIVIEIQLLITHWILSVSYIPEQGLTIYSCNVLCYVILWKIKQYCQTTLGLEAVLMGQCICAYIGRIPYMYLILIYAFFFTLQLLLYTPENRILFLYLIEYFFLVFCYAIQVFLQFFNFLWNN